MLDVLLDKNTLTYMLYGAASGAAMYMLYNTLQGTKDGDLSVTADGESKKPASAKQASLYDRLGGWPALDAAVDKFYVKMMADPRVNTWFTKTNMAHQHRQQKKFLAAAFGGPNEYSGRKMDSAHARLVKEGLGDMEFNAVAENLQNTLLEMGVNKDLVDEVIATAGSLRDEVLCRGPYAAALEKAKGPSKPAKEATLYERLGGWPALDAAVDLFYVKMMADERVNKWFTKTNMAHQHRQQKKFLAAALGGPNEYSGRKMDIAHARMVKAGLGDADFNAVAENLQAALLELGVDKALVDEVIAAADTLRDQVLCRGEYAEALKRC